jgi:hypothetical protein
MSEESLYRKHGLQGSARLLAQRGRDQHLEQEVVHLPRELL